MCKRAESGESPPGATGGRQTWYGVLALSLTEAVTCHGVYETELARMWMPQSKIRLFGFHLSTTAYQLMTLGMELNLSGQ